MKLKDILKISADTLKKAGIETPITDSQLIIANILKIPRWKLITNKEDEIPEEKIKQIEKSIKLRAEGIPLVYLTKNKEFFGIKFYINENVLIPRPETEILVEEVLKRLPENKKIIGLDIGVGSGVIAISLLKNRENLEMIGVDISEKALKVAEINAKLKNVSKRLKLIKSNLFSNIPKDIKFDFIVSNPPYVPIYEYKKLSKEVKREPKVALIAGKDGLAFYERIIKQGKNYLKQNGFIAFEVSYNQSDKIFTMLKKEGFNNIEISKDLNDINRVIIGKF
jgi:release factor glutamine methyltransferase